MSNVTVELSDQSAAFIDAHVESGEFRDREEVVAAALVAMRDRIASFNAEVQLGIDAADRGETLDVVDVRQWLAERRKARAAG